MPATDAVRAALAGVDDPVLDKPITDLGMVAEADVQGATARLHILLPLPGYPYPEALRGAVEEAVAGVDGIERAVVEFGEMTDAQREEAARAAGIQPQPQQQGQGGDVPIPFNDIESDTKVIAIASGKGGVGKSSIATNLACALAAEGHKVGILDADIWGYSIPRMMGATGRPIAFANRVLPLQAHGCKIISIGFFVDSERPVIWRGPMLHRALQQFLADVHWGDLDFLLCDLPPGTGDIAISLAQMLPNADMLVVTTPQQAAQRVALRAGQTTAQTGMKVAGVIENMATFVAPDTGVEYRLFGEGGGELLAKELETDLLGSIPIDPRLREGADEGVPLVVGAPDAPASAVIRSIAGKLAEKKSTIVGKSLPLQF